MTFLHLSAGAVLSAAGGPHGRFHIPKRWWLVAPLAFLSHQWLDLVNGRIFHNEPVWIIALMSLVIFIPLRRHWFGMFFAVLPDIIDHAPTMLGWTTRAQWLPVHRFFWSPRWAEEMPGVLLMVVLAVAVIVLIG